MVNGDVRIHGQNSVTYVRANIKYKRKEEKNGMYAPLLLMRAPFDQQSGSQHLNQLGPMLEGQILSSSPQSSHGRLVRGISLRTSTKERRLLCVRVHTIYMANSEQKTVF